MGRSRVIDLHRFSFMPAVNAVLWINMILDPVFGAEWFAIGGINNMVASLTNLPVLGENFFFALWPVIEPISFQRHSDVSLRCYYQC